MRRFAVQRIYTQSRSSHPRGSLMTSDADPLKGSGITVVTLPILLLDEQWQQLRDEASHYRVSLETMVGNQLSAQLIRTEVHADRGCRINTSPTSIGPSDSN
jgi:hypothetical protein